MTVCDVCHQPSEKFWHNQALLGADDLLCFACFLLWYEEAIVSREEIKRRRAAQLWKAIA